MTDPNIANLGPLAPLAGVWEGSKGSDDAPGPKRDSKNTKYREKMVFEPIGLVENHEQHLYGLRYATTAWPEGASDPFHEEVGYWLWDAKEKQVMRCFMVPRGVTLIAGGTVEPNATAFQLQAKIGSPTYGILSNPFLDREFKTVAYRFDLEIKGDEISYQQETTLQIKDKEELFRHLDANTLKKLSG